MEKMLTYLKSQVKMLFVVFEESKDVKKFWLLSIMLIISCLVVKKFLITLLFLAFAIAITYGNKRLVIRENESIKKEGNKRVKEIESILIKYSANQGSMTLEHIKEETDMKEELSEIREELNKSEDVLRKLSV